MTSGSWTQKVEKWGCWWRVWDEPQDDHIANQCPHSVESTSWKGEVEIWPCKFPQKHGPSMLPDSRATVKRRLKMKIEIRKSGRCQCWGEWHLELEELYDLSYIPVGKRTFPHQRGDSGLFLLAWPESRVLWCSIFISGTFPWGNEQRYHGVMPARHLRALYAQWK